MQNGLHRRHPPPPEMTEVFCHDCGQSLGYQQADTHIDRQYWQHVRCPVRLARNLGVTGEVFDEMISIVTDAVAACYPDFPNNVVGDPSSVKVQTLRAHLAAGAVLECLGVAGFKASKP